MNVIRIMAVSAVCLWVEACQPPVASPPTFLETDDLADEVPGAPSGLTDASEPQQALCLQLADLGHPQKGYP